MTTKLIEKTTTNLVYRPGYSQVYTEGDIQNEDDFCRKDMDEFPEGHWVIPPPDNLNHFKNEGTCQTDLVNHLRDIGKIRTERVAQAFYKVDRGNFANEEPYQDVSASLGYAGVMNAPNQIADAAENLKLHLVDGAKVLDLGSGSGYQTCVFAHMVGPTGKVIGVEHIPELIEASLRNISKGNKDLLDSGRVRIVEADAREGYLPEAPYDVIYYGGCVSEVPSRVLNQLKKGGRILAPIGPMDDFQKLTQIDRFHDNTLQKTDLFEVAYDAIMRKALQMDIHKFQMDPVDENLFTLMDKDSDELFSERVWELKQDPLYTTEKWIPQPPGYTTPGEITTRDKYGRLVTWNYSGWPVV
ncbi:protein-L-isoaspartate(D-aspartate) O-methyltransferase [Diaphorina citri]|uniref:protein-L-isoaspartate(D-aspartate) O-methyltransferase n=1 Tax=Diaphorina citri TaxID=121845 RepID=A0A1S3CWM1_DIACI|nr:protein-L-isoaspartate(D-aspartate) O-methyltransferase [Diaphorina citri]